MTSSAEQFGRAVLADILKDEFFFETESSVDWCKLLERFGYAEFVPYDPEKHGDNVVADPGQDIWVFTDKMRAEARA